MEHEARRRVAIAIEDVAQIGRRDGPCGRAGACDRCRAESHSTSALPGHRCGCRRHSKLAALAHHHHHAVAALGISVHARGRSSLPHRDGWAVTRQRTLITARRLNARASRWLMLPPRVNNSTPDVSRSRRWKSVTGPGAELASSSSEPRSSCRWLGEQPRRFVDGDDVAHRR